MTTKDCVYRHRYTYEKNFKLHLSETKDICYLTDKTFPFKKECKNCNWYVSRYKVKNTR